MYLIAFIGVLMLSISVNGNILGRLLFHGSGESSNGDAQLNVLHKPESVQFAPSPGPIPSNEVSSILSLALGFSVFKDITWQGLLAGSLFNRPKALVVISVDGVPNDFKFNTGSVNVFTIDRKVSESDLLVDMLSMDKHQTLSGHIAVVTDGESMTSSVSADEILSSTGFGNGKHSRTAFWNDLGDSWKVINGQGQSHDEFSRQKLYDVLEHYLPQGFRLDIEDKKVFVNTKDFQLTFDLTKLEEFMLFAELGMIHREIDLLAGLKLIGDNAPDVFTFSLSSLKHIERKYGPDSSEMKAALLLMDKATRDITNKMKKIYSNNVMVVQVNLPSIFKAHVKHKDSLAHVYNSLKSSIDSSYSELEKHFPDVHVPSDLEEDARKKLCETIQTAMKSFSSPVKFRCFGQNQMEHTIRRRSLLQAEEEKDVTDDDYGGDDPDFPIIFNLWFWLMVVLFLAVYTVSLAMWYMDPGRDSVIYRLTQQRIKSD